MLLKIRKNTVWNGQSIADVLPIQLPNGRYLQINACASCEEYSYRGIKKPNNTGRVYTRFISHKKCPHCVNDEDDDNM
jgi:hypothetical protein